MRLLVLTLVLSCCALTGVAQAQVAAPEGPVHLTTKPDHLVGKVVRFSGHAEPGHAVQVEQLGAAGWAPVAKATAAQDGTYRAYWRAAHIGRFRFRAVLGTADGASASTASPEVGLTVYKPAMATWYGPGFYGRKTACGLKMSRRLVGVAHKTLPCGTQVSIHFAGKTVTVPVVDRGPFPRGRDWDLTIAAAKQLGFATMDTVGALTRRDLPAMATPLQAPPVRRR